MNKEKRQNWSKIFRFIKTFIESLRVLLSSCDEISFQIRGLFSPNFDPYLLIVVSLRVYRGGGFAPCISFLTSDLTEGFQKQSFPSLFPLDLRESSPQYLGLCLGVVFSHWPELNIRMSLHLEAIPSKEVCLVGIMGIDVWLSHTMASQSLICWFNIYLFIR